MVKSIEVKNFKSISDLKIDLGRINVFIGENGSGKSNILEAVAFGAAAGAGKLEKEFLSSRGVRIAEPKLMRSAFERDNLDKNVSISFEVPDIMDEEEVVGVSFDLHNKNEEFSKWQLSNQSIFGSSISLVFRNYIAGDLPDEELNLITRVLRNTLPVEELKKVENLSSTIRKDNEKKLQFDSETKRFMSSGNLLNKYKIYAPENTFLRKFEDDEAGDPLGIKGEGLFRLIRYFQQHKDDKYINAIREALSALDWFEDFSISSDLAAGERKLAIVDRFIDSDITISQNSANEGFLFILFYISLFVSEDAPSFFAIDNLDASFNPKLCKHITRTLVGLSKADKFNKQALFTTHNPFILDGLDLTDDEQRLFVVSRTQEGHTVARRVEPNDRKMKLSDQWMNGFLGGLPENF